MAKKTKKQLKIEQANMQSDAREMGYSDGIQNTGSNENITYSFSDLDNDFDNWAGGSVQADAASMGLSTIFRRCREAGLLVYLSGAGADEIISDYGFNGTKFFPHSSFGGKFPKNFSDFFPWESVFLGTQRDYLMKEEITAGAHSLESRYPFLDRQVVQEFIWLSPETKNEIYKRRMD